MRRFDKIIGSRSDGRRAHHENSASSNENQFVEVVGYIDWIRIYGDWGLGSFWTEDRESIKITGQVVKDLKEGHQYRLTGRWKEHPKYGKSIEVLSSAPHIKLDPRAIAKYMVANFDGIGHKSAERMIRHAMDNGGEQGLESLRRQLLDAPWSIDWSPAKRSGTFNGSSEDELASSYVQRDLVTRISAIPGMSTTTIRSLAKWGVAQRSERIDFEKTDDLVADAWRLISSNPYAAIGRIPDFGFLLADAIGKMVNMPYDAPQRLMALVAYAIKKGCETEGHVYLTHEQTCSYIQQVDHQVDPAVAIDYGLQSGSIVLDDGRNERRYYTPDLLAAENEVALAIADMLRPSRPLASKTADLTERIQSAFRQGKPGASAYQLDPSQVEAIRRTLTSPVRVHLITGGPGCGKTSIVETMVRMLNGRQFHFAAPTGKAAKVLTNRIAQTGNHASTIHSLLKGGDGGWRVNSDDPLTGDVLVVDEASMPSLDLYRAILDACNNDMHLILVGDPNQLQSIQPGSVLNDLLTTPGLVSSHLTTVHRNGGGILGVVQEIAAGKMSCRDLADVSFSHELGDAAEMFPRVARAYLEAVEHRGIENVVLLMSRRQGKPDTPGWNTTYANAVLRDMLNPGAEKLPGTANLHVGDRVIIRQNMELTQKAAGPDGEELTERVVNGDTGQILAYERYSGKTNGQSGVQWLRLKLDDGRIIDYPGDAIKSLDHAYAMTVHACQGSEYQEVLAVFTPGVATFVNRNALYTAASRAKSMLRFFAEDHVLRRIAATPAPKRNSALVEKVREFMESEDEDDERAASRKMRHAA